MRPVRIVSTGCPNHGALKRTRLPRRSPQCSFDSASIATTSAIHSDTMRPFVFRVFTLLALLCAPQLYATETDWLNNPAPIVAKITASSDGRELQLSNGLVRRLIRLAPGCATVSLDNLLNGSSV